MVFIVRAFIGFEYDIINTSMSVVITDIKKSSDIFCFIVLLYMFFKVKAK